MLTRLRRPLLALLPALLLALAVGACDSAAYEDGRHHPRPDGLQVEVDVMMDGSAKALRQAFVNTAVQVNASPYVTVHVEPLGGDCRGGGPSDDPCIVVAEDNGRNCGGGINFHALTTAPNGHTHYVRGQAQGDQLIAVNLQDCGATLLMVQHTSCHELLHGLGVWHDATGAKPCDPATGNVGPDDMNVINFLHSSGL